MFENENQCEQKTMVVDKKRISMVIKVVSELWMKWYLNVSKS